ncbi:MAG: type II toxin-antitoxin system HicA family toxin [Nitrosopumilus sp.]|nr:type II toxin-antitoxin system HicA family toxin [Nitrosopumilus sp.]MDA7958964.1 type II toxin-antitoxin system HicA family toxin [Nitrosopumilus sp.]
MRNRTGGHAKFVHRDGRITTLRMHKGELPRGLILTMLSQIGITRREYEDLRGKI